ncbi:response regulator [Pedobacter frigidisoli]|uniref:Response regulator n=1 Tax=Pedobacter frigidisoli TaxID=2530455 RepID=A0A4V6N684_9SPHI|nr:response regulator [Pedobacter frigidisoli]TCD11080.1 response regulator [Pedobacter frigidisoli]
MAKIFVLEDDKDIREVVEWLLVAEDYKVASFGSILDFMSRDQNELPDLFLLDIMLPDGSGLNVCNKLKHNSVYDHIPIIIMSAHASTEQVKMGCKADAFIQKPFELSLFLHTIHSLINVHP